MAITFDRNDGREPFRKELGSGTFRVGVEPATNRIDVLAGPPPAPADTRNSVAASGRDDASAPPPPATEPAPTVTAAR